MNEQEEIMLALPLEADRIADQELGQEQGNAIADEELKGCRLLLVKKKVYPINHERGPSGFIQFACNFQPGDGTRFGFANLSLNFIEPGGIEILELKPKMLEISDDPINPHAPEGRQTANGIQQTSTATGGNRLPNLNYLCKISGTGEGTTLARWNFSENPQRKFGLGGEQVLNLMLLAQGVVRGKAMVTARLIKPGLGGSYQKIRDLILGASSEDRTYNFEFKIP